MCVGRVTVQRNLGEYNGMLGLRHAFSHLHQVEASANLGDPINTPFGSQYSFSYRPHQMNFTL